jgi:hypothetical protein
MRSLSAAVPVLIVIVLLNAPGDAALAEGRPGDEFRHAALEYAQQATDAVEQAAEADGEAVGRYMQLAMIFQEMAGIKRRAASLADVERWDKITWERYRELEDSRDAVLDELAEQHSPKVMQAVADDELIIEARAYREHAERARAQARQMAGVERAIYRELAELLNRMAAIKDRAADAVRNGEAVDWARYEELSARRQKLENMLEAAR